MTNTRSETANKLRKLQAEYWREYREEWRKSNTATDISLVGHHTRTAFHAMGKAHGIKTALILIGN